MPVAKTKWSNSGRNPSFCRAVWPKGLSGMLSSKSKLNYLCAPKPNSMLTGMLHTHKLVVLLFLLIYLIKTVLLLLSKNDALDTFSKKVKVPEMIVSFLFLATGIFLAMNSGDIGPWFWCKIGAVAASIPLAVIAFKKKQKALAALSLFLIIYAYGVSETKSPIFKKEKIEIASTGNPLDEGKQIYMTVCTKCHGENGKQMLAGAKDLTITTLSKEDIIHQVKFGKNLMPGYKGQLSDEEITAVVDYIATLKTN
jgi:mono/diheme cytochrome c family protein